MPRFESDVTGEAATNAATFFAERRERADFEAFGRIMRKLSLES